MRGYARDRFELARRIDPAPLPPVAPRPAESAPAPDKPRREQFYAKGQTQHRDPKPYAHRIAEPLGSREDFKRDTARNWSRAQRPKD